MKSINKEDKKRLSEFITKLSVAKTKVENKHKELSSVVDSLNDLLQNYNEILDEVDSFREDLVRQMEEYYDERSERWQQGEAGESYSEWKDVYAGIDLSEVPEIETPELPEMEHTDYLDELPDEPG